MSKRYLKTFFAEKDIDQEQTFEIVAKDGTWNLMSYGVVIEAILNTGAQEQAEIANMIRRIDFANGDIKRYLRHLAQALADMHAEL